MSTIPVVATDRPLLDRIAPLMRSCHGCDADLVHVPGKAEAIEYFRLGLPDLAFVHFSDPNFDGFAFLDEIQTDAWLLHTGIIAVCGDDDSAPRLEEMRGANIIIALADEDLEARLPKVLDIIVQNQRILFQRAMGADLMHTISGSFKIQNDTVEANCYVNLICNFLYSAGKLDADGKMSVHLALTEMFLNAIEHGNCGITYDEKGAWLEEGNSMSQLIAQKCQDPAVQARRVLFEYAITPQKSTFFIADEGQGFDWRKQQDAISSGKLHEVHGRGIRMTRKYTKNLHYNEAGNQVTFEVEHPAECVNDTPALFENMPPRAVNAGDIIFREGESGDFLYYIAKGHYDVSVNGALVSTLSADDVFMGEMSCLLNNRRSATVRATTAGTLIRVSKKDFVAAIQRKPHYAMFLARLLAQRVQRGHAGKASA